MLNRLTKIRHHKGPGPHFHPFETTQAMMYAFMKKFWQFFEPLSLINYNVLSNNNDNKNLFNETCHKYNILGKVTKLNLPCFLTFLLDDNGSPPTYLSGAESSSDEKSARIESRRDLQRRS